MNNAQSTEPRETYAGNKGRKKARSSREQKKKIPVILSFIDFKPSNKNRRKPDLFTGSIVITRKSLKQWEVNGKGIIAVFYVPFLPLSFMSPEKDFIVSKMQHNFKMQQHSCIYTRRPLKHTNLSCQKKKKKDKINWQLNSCKRFKCISIDIFPDLNNKAVVTISGGICGN